MPAKALSDVLWTGAGWQERYGRRFLRCYPGPGGTPCLGDLVGLPAGQWDWLHLRLADAREHGVRQAGRAQVWLHYRTAVDPEWLYPVSGLARVPLTRLGILTAIRLPDLPWLTVIAATLQSPPQRTAASHRAKHTADHHPEIR